MKRPFDALWATLQKSLDSLDQDLAGEEQYSKAIGLIRENLLEVQALVYEQYLVFLHQQRSGMSGNNRRRLEWKESKSAAVELIKSQAEAGSIYVDGLPASTGQLKEDFEERYDCDLKDFDALLYASDTRKKDPTPYLTKLVRAFMRRRERLRK